MVMKHVLGESQVPISIPLSLPHVSASVGDFHGNSFEFDYLLMYLFICLCRNPLLNWKWINFCFPPQQIPVYVSFQLLCATRASLKHQGSSRDQRAVQEDFPAAVRDLFAKRLSSSFSLLDLSQQREEWFNFKVIMHTFHLINTFDVLFLTIMILRFFGGFLRIWWLHEASEFQELCHWLFLVALALLRSALREGWSSKSPTWIEGFIKKEEEKASLQGLSGSWDPGTSILRSLLQRAGSTPMLAA